MIKNMTGVVLAGGKSSRFGSNKSFAKWNGKPLIQTVVESMRTLFGLTLVVTKDQETFSFLQQDRVRIVKDLHDETFTLGGIASGLHYAKPQSIFVCGCDMPFLKTNLITLLANELRTYDAVVPVWGEKLQPLSSVISSKCVGVIERMIQSGNLKAQNLFEKVRTRFLSEEELKKIDPWGHSFLDIDTLEDYKKALMIQQEALLTHAH